MKNFKYAESNKTIDLAISIEKLVGIINKKIDKGEMEIEAFIAWRNNINELLGKNMELVEKWESEVKK